MKIRLTVEYCGECYSGWQLQPQVRTVQGELQDALGCYLSSLAKRQGLGQIEIPQITASGRTDAGVHARGQVVSFPWPEEFEFSGRELVGALNGIASREMSVLSAVPESDDFDARRSPHIKCYRYTLLLRGGNDALFQHRVWRITRTLDVRQMIAAAGHFRGTYDFSSFRAADCSANTAVRTICLSEISRPEPSLLVYSIWGKGFLKQMVRAIVGTLVEVGYGSIKSEDIPRIIEARDRSCAGPTAPADGLTLEWVRYF